MSVSTPVAAFLFVPPPRIFFLTCVTLQLQLTIGILTIGLHLMVLLEENALVLVWFLKKI